MYWAILYDFNNLHDYFARSRVNIRDILLNLFQCTFSLCKYLLSATVNKTLYYWMVFYRWFLMITLFKLFS